MAIFKNLELRDNIRNDALNYMKKNPNVDYAEAYDIVKKKLIGEQNIIDFKFKPLQTSINLPTRDLVNEQADLLYYEDLKERLKNIINVDDYNNEQLEQYVIAHEMGVDITKFADNNYNSEQIKFLCMLCLTGQSLNKYIKNYDFDPDKEMLLLGLN